MIEGELLNILANNGIIGAVLAWFMFRMERHIQNNTAMMESVRESMRECRKNVYPVGAK